MVLIAEGHQYHYHKIISLVKQGIPSIKTSAPPVALPEQKPLP